MSLNYNIEWFTNNIKNEFEAIKFFQNFNIIPLNKVCKNGHSMKLYKRIYKTRIHNYK